MKSVTLTVNVYGGALPPVPIKVYLDGPGDNDHQKFSKDSSFSYTFSLAPGNYQLMVGGQNPAGGSTTVILAGDISSGPIPTSPQSQNTAQYAFIFYFTV